MRITFLVKIHLKSALSAIIKTAHQLTTDIFPVYIEDFFMSLVGFVVLKHLNYKFLFFIIYLMKFLMLFLNQLALETTCFVFFSTQWGILMSQEVAGK